MAKQNNIQIPGYRPYWSTMDINVANSYITPTTVKYADSASYHYWIRSFYERLLSSIKMDLPEMWQSDIKSFFQWCLVTIGYVGVFRTDDYGLVFQPGSIGGYDFYYQPVWLQVSNPKYNKKLNIHEDCELIRFTPDYIGVWEIINRYALECALLDPGINMSLINNKYAKIFFGKSKAAAATIQKGFDLINRGEPGIVFDDELPDDNRTKEAPFQFWVDQDLQKNYITDKQLRDLQTIVNQFDSEIGIPTVPYEKKERMVTSEAESKQDDAQARAKTWVECLQSSSKVVMEKFPELKGKLDFSLRYADDGPDDPEEPEEVEDDDR